MKKWNLTVFLKTLTSSSWQKSHSNVTVVTSATKILLIWIGILIQFIKPFKCNLCNNDDCNLNIVELCNFGHLNQWALENIHVSFCHNICKHVVFLQYESAAILDCNHLFKIFMSLCNFRLWKLFVTISVSMD